MFDFVAAGYRTRTRFRAMSTSVNSTPVNEKDEQVFQDFKLLNAVDDRYGGVIVEVREAMDSALFGSVLRASIAQWRHQVFFITLLLFLSQEFEKLGGPKLKKVFKF